MIKPENLAKVMALAIGNSTYLATRTYILDEIQAGIMSMPDFTTSDKEKYLRTLYTCLGYEEYKGATGSVFKKGSQMRTVASAPKLVKTAKNA